MEKLNTSDNKFEKKTKIVDNELKWVRDQLNVPGIIQPQLLEGAIYPELKSFIQAVHKFQNGDAEEKMKDIALATNAKTQSELKNLQAKELKREREIDKKFSQVKDEIYNSNRLKDRLISNL